MAPDWKRELRERLAPARLDPAREEEIVEELAQHLEQRWEELALHGVSREEAARALGGELDDALAERLARVAPRARAKPAPGAAPSGGAFTGLLGDLKYGARQLRLNPGFALVSILSLALGTGANTAIFQLLDAVGLRSLPVPHPEQLAIAKIVDAKAYTGGWAGPNSFVTNPLWEQVRERQQGFSRIAVWGNDRMDLSRGGESRFAETIWVSGDFFGMLGARPALGRLVSPADDRRGCAAIAVLSEPFWRREYGGAPDVLGRTITLDGRAVPIAGVTAAGFSGVEVGRGFDVALPVCAEPLLHGEYSWLDDRAMWWLAPIGRLKPGWTVERASAQLAAASRGMLEATLAPRYNAIDAKDYLAFHFGVLPARSGVSNLRRKYESPLLLLLGISGLVLVIACANLANLLLARAGARRREMAVRLALGASRARLVRQLVAESLLLALAGALLGAGLAQALSRLLVSFLATGRRPLVLDLAPDARVFGFTLLLAAATCVLFGLTPAIQAARTAPGEALKASARGVAGGHGRLGLRRSLVASQVALSLVLLVGALLFVRTLRNLTTQDTGFRSSGIVTADVDLSPLRPPKERRTALRREILDRVRSAPGIRSAATAVVLPLTQSIWNEDIRVGDARERQIANFDRVSPGYFETMGMRLVAGRDLDARDVAGTPEVAVVTETFVRMFLPGVDPVGRTFSRPDLKPPLVYQIVGVVRDSKYGNLREDFSPIAFFADAQDPNPDPSISLVVRSELPAADVVAAVKRAVAEVSPSALLSFRTLDDLLREGSLSERLMATLSGFFGFLAAVLAMVGLYGVVSYMVTQRRNEIGVRIALGADRGDIVRLVMGEAGRLLGLGLAVGAALALLAATSARALLYGLTPTDPLTVLAAAVSLASVAALASLLPAQRAARLDSARALRDE